MRNPSVLMVCQVLPPAYGGAGNQALCLAEALVARGCTVRLVGSMSPGARRGETNRGVSLRRLGFAWPGRIGRLMFYASLLVHVMRHCREFDVVHVHGVFWPAVVCAFVTRLAGIPLVLKMTRMGDDDVATLEALRMRSFAGSLRAWPLRLSPVMVALNASMLADCRSSRSALRCELLPNGVDTNFWRQPSLGERQSARQEFATSGQVVLYSGGLLQHKGLALLLDALSLVRRPVTLVVAGAHDTANPEVDASLARKLDAWASEHRTMHRVLRAGLVEPGRMRELYWGSDVYVLPTEREGNPNALLEAMACGVACVATRVPGVVDAGMPENCYRGTGPGNAEELRQALELLADAVRRSTVRCFAARYIRESRSMMSLAATYEGLYRELRRDR